MSTTTRTAAGAMVVMMAALAAGCGGEPDDASLGTTTTTSAPAPKSSAPAPSATPTPKPTPKPSSIAGLSAAQILTKTQAAAKAANSVRVKGAMTDGTDKLGLDVRLATAGGGGSITMGGDTISVMVIGKTAYFRMSDGFWRKQAKTKAEANAMIGLIGGRWIKTSLTNKDLGELALFASKSQFFDGLFEETGKLKKVAPKTVDGIACVGLSDDDGTLWVDAATARPVRIESGKDALAFTDYNRVAIPKAPPANQLIDGKALGM